jgi:hypothetical protein
MGTRRRTFYHSKPGILAWAFALVALLVTACAPFGTATRQPVEPTPTPTSTQAAATLPAATPTPSATATPGVSPMDLCLEYQELLVSAGETTERAVVTSYQCRNAHIDSTGQSPSKSPTLF